MGKLLVLMMGLPRSGKSTKAQQLSLERGWPIVNRDSIRIALHGQRYVPEAEPMVKAISLVMVRALFNAGHDAIIVDETSIRFETRKFWGSGVPSTEWATKVFNIDTPPEVCLERAASMDDEVIMDVIERMAIDLEPLQETELEFREGDHEIPGKSS